ncbi:dUTP diphosphatase [Sporosarcina highlanderae]|uniref:dUTP diphosphatase n=1 Tax=Sporosarcina highlanderae TaxID=3035916 RepID=A0ABT8JQ46_9BACL|nr:dUTP diphosphatase [Sporosarcina highlanderae]MDN4607270.1 dUTP diphosphatase [Sporosarcina highlanderae]
MNFSTLFTMQRELDNFIQTNQAIEKDVFREKGLALVVELAELANETRCFKFWSTKGPSERDVILEEYVDSIHFILSIGIEKGFDVLNEWPEGKVNGELTEIFIETITSIQTFIFDPTMENYKSIWIHYGSIASRIGFSYSEIINAYIEKNEKNYTRQRTGY